MRPKGTRGSLQALGIRSRRAGECRDRPQHPGFGIPLGDQNNLRLSGVISFMRTRLPVIYLGCYHPDSVRPAPLQKTRGSGQNGLPTQVVQE